MTILDLSGALRRVGANGDRLGIYPEVRNLDVVCFTVKEEA